MSDLIRKLVLEVYDTVADASRWAPTLDRIADMINARGCIVFEWDYTGPDRRLIAPQFSSGYEADLIAGYLASVGQYETVDQDTFEAHSLATDRIDLVDDSVLAETEEELLARPNVRLLEEYGIRHRAAGLLDKDNKARSRFSVQLGTHRGRLTPDEHQTMAQILPHIAKALDLGRPAQHLAQLQTGLLAAIDRLRIGICLLDRSGRVVVNNSEFDRQREVYDAFVIDPTGRLRPHADADARMFSFLLADALNHGRHGARPRKEAIPTNIDGQIGALCIEVAPLDRVAEIGTTPFQGAILYSLDTSLPLNCNLDQIQRVYNLTRTEAGLIDLVGEGLTNAQIAERRERSVETVNAQIKSILSKTQSANRTQLVRLLTNFGTAYLKP